MTPVFDHYYWSHGVAATTLPGHDSHVILARGTSLDDGVAGEVTLDKGVHDFVRISDELLECSLGG